MLMIFKNGEKIIVLLICTVHTAVDSDETDIVRWEKKLRILSAGSVMRFHSGLLQVETNPQSDCGFSHKKCSSDEGHGNASGLEHPIRSRRNRNIKQNGTVESLP